MRSLLLILLVLAFACSACSAIIISPDTFCSKYAGALFGDGADATNQTSLIRAVVVRAATGCPAGIGPGTSCENPTTTIATYPAFIGLFDPKSPVLEYFNGEDKFRVDVPDFTTNSTELTALVDHLVSFFGSAFGCTAAGFPAFSPTRWSNLHLVHKNMHLDQEDFDFFNAAVTTSLASYGVVEDDLLAVALPFLQTFGRCAGSREICTAEGCEIARNSVSGSTGLSNLQPGCVMRESLRLTQVKIDSAIIHLQGEAADSAKKWGMPVLGLAGTYFILTVFILFLTSLIFHRVKGIPKYSGGR